MNNAHIAVQVIESKRYDLTKVRTYPNTMRLILYSHGLKHPDCKVIVHFDVRSENGFNKRMKELRERRDYINSGGF